MTLAKKVKLNRFCIATAIRGVGLQVHHRFSCFFTWLEQHLLYGSNFAKFCKHWKTKIQDNCCYTNYNCHQKVKSRAAWMLLNIIHKLNDINNNTVQCFFLLRRAARYRWCIILINCPDSQFNPPDGRCGWSLWWKREQK